MIEYERIIERRFEMARKRKDQESNDSNKDRITILVDIDVIEALNELADAKNISRNALIASLLGKAVKSKLSKGVK